MEESSFSGPAALLLLKNKTTLALWRCLRYHGDRGEPTRNKKGERENRPAVHSFVKTDYYVMKFVSCGTNLTDYDDDL